MTEMARWSDGSRAEIDIPRESLDLRFTLDCGQAFRWHEDADGSWTGVTRGRAIRLKREGPVVAGDVYPPVADPADFLATYLRLDVDLGALYGSFGAIDDWIAEAIVRFSGLRLLDQDPEETLLSYVCSTANSVPRISKAVREMSRIYGRLIGVIDGKPYHSFPTPESLAEASPVVLREECGLGWRGDNLRSVAAALARLPAGWLEGLRGLPYPEAKERLTRIRGVGAKIADCVCLFALRKDEAVPVDTHIWAVARELFGARVPTTTLTPGTYEAIARMYVERYGRYAGWAQEYLYLWRRASQGRVRLA